MTDPTDQTRPRIVLGPMLRHVDDSRATFWVETDRPCTVEVVVGDVVAQRPTFQICGHSYAIVVAEGLPSGRETPYAVRLDGQQVWPEPDSFLPGSRVRTSGHAGPLRVTFGSCRVSAPHGHPYTRSGLRDRNGWGVDALRALALELSSTSTDTAAASWPDLMVLTGDQVYADENISPMVLDRISQDRSFDVAPGPEVANFLEYTVLYQDSWGEPTVRWLFSTVPSVMVFDDHDVRDDWNTSYSWLEEIRQESWWPARIEGAMMAYWVYQHLGNLTPEELAKDHILNEVEAAAARGEDGGEILRRFASSASVEEGGRQPEVGEHGEPIGPGPHARWSYAKDLGKTRLVVLDARAGRVLTPGARRMIDDVEWEWVKDRMTGDVDHLLVASSVPVLMPLGIHHMESWNEKLADGAWGARWQRWSENARQAVDMEHWAAFRSSFDDLVAHLVEVGRGEHGRAPGSILLLSGDVHFGYLDSARPVDGPPMVSKMWQGVSSPIRNPVQVSARLLQRVATRRPLVALTRKLARSAGIADPTVEWQRRYGPWFGNQLMTMVLDGRFASAEIHTSGQSQGQHHLYRNTQVSLTS